MLQHVLRKSSFKVRLEWVNTLFHLQLVWKLKLVTKYTVVRPWQKVQSNLNVSLKYVIPCQLKLIFLQKYKKFTVAKG